MPCRGPGPRCSSTAPHRTAPRRARLWGGIVGRAGPRSPRTRNPTMPIPGPRARPGPSGMFRARCSAPPGSPRGRGAGAGGWGPDGPAAPPCRSSTIFARTIDPHEISTLRSLQAFSDRAPIGGVFGGLPTIDAAFLRTPPPRGCIILQHPPSGGYVTLPFWQIPPPLGGYTPRRGEWTLFWGGFCMGSMDNQWTTNGQPMDNQQKTSGTPAEIMAEKHPPRYPIDRL
jgi:hypothetical protein